MSRIKDLSNFVDVMGKSLSNAVKKQDVIYADLYASIKEVAELKYRIVELNTKLANLEATVKIIHEKVG